MKKNATLTCLLVTLGLLLPRMEASAQNAPLVHPPAPPGTNAITYTFPSIVVAPIPDGPGGILTTSILVAGLQPYVFDIDLTTTMLHTSCGDLDITLTSPEGTTVVLTTDNGGAFDDVFWATLWDDDAVWPATDWTYQDFVIASPLVPEGALGAFVGEDPNGAWELRIEDDAGGETGFFDSWILRIRVLDAIPAPILSSFTALPGGPVPDAGGSIVASTAVSGLDPYLLDVNLTTDIVHTFSGDVDMWLTSPEGTTVIIATDNGGAVNDMYSGTLWDDDAPVPVSDAVPAPNLPLLAPEGALAAFIGEDPNGVWSLEVVDDAALATGTLNSWALDLVTTSVALPVELTSFEAVVVGGAAILNWTTATETNNAGFEVQVKEQRSNGEGEWESLAFVEGAGTTDSQQKYSYRAGNLEPGTWTFRLKQIDYDGSYGYSHSVEVTRELAEAYALKPFYPNPFNPQGTFTVMVARDQDVRIAMYNIMGQLVDVIHDGFLVGQEWHAFTVNAQALPSGSYMLRAEGEYFVSTQQVALVK